MTQLPPQFELPAHRIDELQTTLDESGTLTPEQIEKFKLQQAFDIVQVGDQFVRHQHTLQGDTDATIATDR